MLLEKTIDCNYDNKKLKSYLKNELYISTRLLNKLKNYHCIKVNDNDVYVNYILKTNDIVKIDFSKINEDVKFSDKFKIVEANLDVLYEDEYLLIINKEAGIAVHPSCNNYDNTLANIVGYYLKKQNIDSINIITRLDRNTSGICIFAKNPYIHELFNRKKEQINMQKFYLCVVDGIVEKDHDIIDTKICRTNDSIILREVTEDGDDAKTEYFTLSRNYDRNYSVVKVLLHTGRTHQIRVHMASIGHTLLGDDLYAKVGTKSTILKHIKRQALHSINVVFNHPINNTKISISSNLPEDMLKLKVAGLI